MVNKHQYAGDYNMSLMDQLNADPELNMVPCCNELNAGRAFLSRTRNERHVTDHHLSCGAQCRNYRPIVLYIVFLSPLLPFLMPRMGPQAMFRASALLIMSTSQRSHSEIKCSVHSPVSLKIPQCGSISRFGAEGEGG